MIMRLPQILVFVTEVLFLLLTQLQSVYPQCSRSDLTAVETLSVTDALQEFKSPGYRVAYYPRMDCQWIFDAGRSDATIVFDIREMLIENSVNCNYDSLTFYQGGTTSDPEVKKLCGRLYNGQYVTVTGRYALLRMRSDRSRQYAGAKINYFYAQEKSGNACSGTPASLTATSTVDFLTTPGFPATQISNGAECQWTITSGAGTVIYMEIVYMDLGSIEGMCYEQKLSIYDGSSSSDPALVEEMCDMRTDFPTQAVSYYTTGNTAFISLWTVAESFAESYGFKINYNQHGTAVITTTAAATTTTEVTVVCSSSPTNLQATTDLQLFQSINYPEDYPNNANCLWLIEAPVGFTINLTFVDSLLQPGENCQLNDAVNVFDGNSMEHPLMTSFCGEAVPSVVSTGRYLYIQLSTDSSVTYRGFSAQFQTVTAELPSCAISGVLVNYTATDSIQEISSPGFPSSYNDSQTYYWMIHNPNETQVLTLSVDASSRLEGSLSCQYDSVQIYQGPCTTYPLLGQFCGTNRPTYYYDTGSYALIVMTTDDSVSYTGFKLSFYLTDKSEDDSNTIALVGIIVGSVVGSLALVSGTAFGVVKYLEHRKKGLSGSPDHSRRSSKSSMSSVSDREDTRQDSQRGPRRLPPISESRRT